MEDLKTFSIMGTGLLISVLDIIPILQIIALLVSIVYGLIKIKDKL
jgi:hypothetical protein